MCGIVGYWGKNAAAPLLLDGLSRLEYRGYDSAGIALLDDSGIAVYKEAGRLSVLTARLHGGEDFAQTVGIGHTRWATHGAPTTQNAHPHLSDNGKFAVVHNGIIENEAELRRELVDSGVTLRSDTDTELIAQLLEREDNGDVLDTLRRVCARLTGSFALGVLCTATPQTVYAVRCQSPLIIGVAEDGLFLASDMPAVLPFTRRFVPLADGEIATLSADGYAIYDKDNRVVTRDSCIAEWDAAGAERGAYAHFMRKEIDEQPEALAATVFPLLYANGGVHEDVLPLNEDEADGLERVIFVGCGSAYHAGLVGAQVVERLARVTAEAQIASEFRYRNAIVNKNTLVIGISQSGETADTLAALREAKQRGARVMAVVNVEGSTLAAESDAVLLTRAGPEIAVATTKAYTAQLAVLYLVSIRLAVLRGSIDRAEESRLTTQLRKLPSQVRRLLTEDAALQQLAQQTHTMRDAYFMGRGLDCAAAMEGALKLKEISYVHAEAYAAGELKHGTISLIEDGTFVVALACEETMIGKTLANVREVRARGARVLLITTDQTLSAAAEHVLVIPQTEPLFVASLSAIPMQLFSYYAALTRGCDIDRPRNLAKSVTVE